MPPHRTASASLTPDDIAALTTAIADGKRATVYLRDGVPGLGLAPGVSARVLSVSGSTLMLKPRGVNDELPFEADEVRMSKNPPPEPEPKKKRARAAASAEKSTPASPPPPKPSATKPTPARTTPARGTPSKDTSANAAPAKTTTARSASPRPARKPTKSKGPVSVAVTVYGSPDNEWSVSVVRGGRKPQRSRPVTPESVDAAMRALGDDPAVDAVTGLLNAAREEARRRVEELSRELDEARRALEQIEGTDSTP